jgi:hypothetical protein
MGAGFACVSCSWLLGGASSSNLIDLVRDDLLTPTGMSERVSVDMPASSPSRYWINACAVVRM